MQVRKLALIVAFAAGSLLAARPAHAFTLCQAQQITSCELRCRNTYLGTTLYNNLIYLNAVCGLNSPPNVLPWCDINTFVAGYTGYSFGCAFAAYFYGVAPGGSNVSRVQNYDQCIDRCFYGCGDPTPPCIVG